MRLFQPNSKQILYFKELFVLWNNCLFWKVIKVTSTLNMKCMRPYIIRVHIRVYNKVNDVIQIFSNRNFISMSMKPLRRLIYAFYNTFVTNKIW